MGGPLLRRIAFSGVVYLLVLLLGSVALALGAGFAWGLTLLFGPVVSFSEFASITLFFWIAGAFAGTVGFIVHTAQEWRLDRRARQLAEVYRASEMLRLHWEEEGSLDP